MPSVTLNVSGADAARIHQALASTPYPRTEAGFKQMLTAYVVAWVKEYERNERLSAAVAQVVVPVDVALT